MTRYYLILYAACCLLGSCIATYRLVGEFPPPTATLTVTIVPVTTQGGAVDHAASVQVKP